MATLEPVDHDPFAPIPLAQTSGRTDAPWQPDRIAPPPKYQTSMADNPISRGIGEAILSPISEAGEYVGGLMQGTIPFEPGEAVKEGLKLGSAFIGPKVGGGALAGMFAPAVKSAAKDAAKVIAPEADHVASIYKKLLSDPKWSGSYEDGPAWTHIHEMFPDMPGPQKQKVADYLHAYLEGDAKTKPVMDLGGMETPIPKNFGTTPSIAKDIEREGGWTLDRHVPPPEALRSGFDQPAYHSTREFEGRKLKPEDFYSTPDPELASLYAGSDYVSSSKYGAAQTLPLLLKTRDYHTVDAVGKNWQAVNSDAIREARERGAPGVRINNVWDEPHTQGNLSEPKTVFISLDPSTVRSRFAKFDPAKMQLNDLLASGAAISLPSSVLASKMLVPVDHDPFAPKKFARGGRVMIENIDAAPTEAQKEAGNYAKDHVHIHGMDLTIENAKGAKRSGVGRDGKPWSVKMPAHYGYIKGTIGKDKDHVDIYLGPHPKSPHVFVIDQADAETKKFDEHKVMLGFSSRGHAKRTYLAGFSDGKGSQRLGHLSEMDVSTFKKWLDSGDTMKPMKKD